MPDNTANECLAFKRHDHRRCQRQLLSAARKHCEAKKLRLTSRRSQVLEILLGSHQPMGAYDILAELNQRMPEDRIAPPIVYRALEFLLDEALIHRLESKNAFISCIHPGRRCAAHFLICRNCDKVAELENSENSLLDEAGRVGFAVDYSVVETTGVCAECQKHA
ncbi:MAG: Fur family zinc uptake transcriptional regulator [Gammaproteobacteria bacterium]|jgi:Fur family zinc uptake transcriptional regulator